MPVSKRLILAPPPDTRWISRQIGMSHASSGLINTGPGEWMATKATVVTEAIVRELAYLEGQSVVARNPTLTWGFGFTPWRDQPVVSSDILKIGYP